MRRLTLTVNGRKVTSDVEPRTHLADFLRGHVCLTGTHLGCEHGVCGACTVMIDGAPARSCITFAVACESAEITTIEGFEDDAVMARLREAFSRHHGLQCGYCTPGMLITAHDIVTRLCDADEKRIRLELSGNLCRCTGYVGIVDAIAGVLEACKRERSASTANRGLGPVGARTPSAPGAVAAETPPRLRPETGERTVSVKDLELERKDWAQVENEGVALTQSFEVSHPRDEVWGFFADLDGVARCMPGAVLTGPPKGGRAQGVVSIRLGPIETRFHGVLDVERDEANYKGFVRGAGRDAKSASNARAVISYALTESDVGTHVEVSVKFLLAGPLAQFSRSGLVKDIADHLTRAFARNLEVRLSVGEISGAAKESTLDAGKLARAAVWSRIKRFFRNLFAG